MEINLNRSFLLLPLYRYDKWGKYFIGIYEDKDFVKTLKYIRDISNPNDNITISGKIIFKPKEGSFPISIYKGEIGDMIYLLKDPKNTTKRSEITLLDSNPSFSKIVAEYDTNSKSILFKYDDDEVGDYESGGTNLDDLIKLLDNNC